MAFGILHVVHARARIQYHMNIVSNHPRTNTESVEYAAAAVYNLFSLAIAIGNKVHDDHMDFTF